MIRVGRTQIPRPDVLAGKQVRTAKMRASSFFNEDSPASKQRNFAFDAPTLSGPALREALYSLFNGRCAYCSVYWPQANLQVDHFRPRQGAVSSDGKSSRLHYFWLAYEWENLYLACAACNAAKGSKFPVGGSRAEPNTSGSALAAELAGLIDPCSEDPEALFAYLPSGQVISSDTRGRQTIDVLALNRPELVNERKRVASDTVLAIQRAMAMLDRQDFVGCVHEIESLFDTTMPLAAVRRQFANSRVQLRRKRIHAAFAQEGKESRLSELTVGLRRLTNRDLRQLASEYLNKPVDEVPTSCSISQAAWESALQPTREETHSREFRSTAPNAYRLKSFGVRSIYIDNFLGVSDLHIDFAEGAGSGPWTMLLGENGAGKTTVLQAIAFALASDSDIRRSGIKPSGILKHGSPSGSVIVTLSAGEGTVGRYFSRGLNAFEQVGYAPESKVISYGATRLLPKPTTRVARRLIPGFGNLFDARVSLPGTNTWLPRITDDEFQAVARAMRRLLLIDDETAYFTREKNGQLVLHRSGSKALRLSQLSAGYQAMATLALDLMRSLLDQWDSLEAAEGVVLIDELGAHLHPRWQMRVVGAIRSALPRVQVVATTHDPLCLRGLRDGEVRVLTARPNGQIIVDSDLPAVESLSVDQLLTSEHFGLSSTVDPQLELVFSEYYDLLSQEPLDSSGRARVAELRHAIESHRLMGQTRRERLLLEAADQFIAADRSAESEVERRELRSDIRARLRGIWEEGLG